MAGGSEKWGHRSGRDAAGVARIARAARRYAGTNTVGRAGDSAAEDRGVVERRDGSCYDDAAVARIASASGKDVGSRAVCWAGHVGARAGEVWGGGGGRDRPAHAHLARAARRNVDATRAVGTQHRWA